MRAMALSFTYICKSYKNSDREKCHNSLYDQGLAIYLGNLVPSGPPCQARRQHPCPPHLSHIFPHVSFLHSCQLHRGVPGSACPTPLKGMTAVARINA